MIEKQVRKDKLKNKITVVKAVIKDPLATQDEIVKRTGLGKGTVNRNIQELGKTGLESDIMDRVLGMDDQIMDLANQITLQKIINEAPKKDDWTIDVSALSLVDVKLIGDYANNSTKRKAIFGKWDKIDPNREIIIQI